MPLSMTYLQQCIRVSFAAGIIQYLDKFRIFYCCNNINNNTKNLITRWLINYLKKNIRNYLLVRLR